MKKPANSLRIIGGIWRGRKLRFNDQQELRPTLNRIRETLFNWLAPVIADSVCLDLFAGSGALGFEALSRGAKQVVMVDRNRETINALKKNAELLGTTNIEFICLPFSPELKNIFTQKFNIVFLDPPFHQGLAAPTCHWLETENCLADGALIYIETEKELKNFTPPTNWKILRHKTEGQISYYLCQRL
jgi:16S rRNA (guanine966-N2)-methyltransferase